MREIVSEAPPSASRRLFALAVVLSLSLIWVGFAIVLEVFGAANPLVLGLNVGIGFAVMALLALTYYRLFHPHRIVIERGEDLW